MFMLTGGRVKQGAGYRTPMVLLVYVTQRAGGSLSPWSLCGGLLPLLNWSHYLAFCLNSLSMSALRSAVEAAWVERGDGG